MASVIKIKKSGTTAVPSTLASGELAYSWSSDKLFVGYGTESVPGEADNIAIIGGKYYIDMLDHTAGSLTANSALIVDANSKLDSLLVDNLQLNGNALTSTDTNGNILITPNGTGSIILDNQNWPQADGSADQVLKTNGTGQLSWHTPHVYLDNIVEDSSPQLGGDLDVNGHNIGGTGITIQPDINYDLSLTASGTGKISLNSQYWPASAGNTGQFLKTGDNGQLSWSAVPSGSFDINGDTGSTTFTTGETLSILGSGSIDTEINGNTVTVSAVNATASIKGVASFSSSNFTVTDGAVSIKSSGISNTELANSSITIGTDTISLGGSITALDLTELTVDNLSINENSITATDTNGNITLVPNGTGVVDVTDSRITGVATPVNDTDAANKLYVDNAINGLDYKESVHLLASTNVTLSGTSGTLVIDGHNALTSAETGYRILLTGQTSSDQNGIYVYSDNGSTYTLARAADADAYTELQGTSVFVVEGTTYGTTGWIQTNHYLTSFSGQQWVQFSGAGQYTAGDGLTLNGTVFAVGAGNGITVSSDSISLANTVAGNGLTYTNGVVDAVGTTDRITVSANAIDIAATYAGQTSIVTLGTITTGTWNANVIGVEYGGTGLSSITARGLIYGNGTSTVGVLNGASQDGMLLKQDSSGNPYWSSTLEGGSF